MVQDHPLHPRGGWRNSVHGTADKYVERNNSKQSNRRYDKWWLLPMREEKPAATETNSIIARLVGRKHRAKHTSKEDAEGVRLRRKTMEASLNRINNGVPHVHTARQRYVF